MGEMADELIDNILDADSEFWSPYGDYPGYSDTRCSHCGKRCRWVRPLDASRWMLVTDSGKPHRCKELVAARVASPDEFPDMT